MIADRVKRIMADQFKVELSAIGDDITPESIDKWDSLGHINLIIAMENEFNIKFDDDDILEMISYKAIIKAISEKTQ